MNSDLEPKRKEPSAQTGSAGEKPHLPQETPKWFKEKSNHHSQTEQSSKKTIVYLEAQQYKSIEKGIEMLAKLIKKHRKSQKTTEQQRKLQKPKSISVRTNQKMGIFQSKRTSVVLKEKLKTDQIQANRREEPKLPLEIDRDLLQGCKGKALKLQIYGDEDLAKKLLVVDRKMSIASGVQGIRDL